MKDFPSCFGENGVQVADPSSSIATKTAQNLVSCIYLCKSHGGLRSITLTWTKHLMGQSLNIAIDNLCKVDIKPWLFSKRKGFKNLQVEEAGKIHILWDLTNAKFGSNSSEPLEGFYLAVVFDQETVLLLGDLETEAKKKIGAYPIQSNSIFIGKKECVFGKKFFGAKSQFCDKGKIHDISIECETVCVNDPFLVIRIDGKIVLQIKRLKWKFRGNYTILVDGFPVEVYWDVHNWLFGNAMNSAVFMFQTCLSSFKKFWPSQSVLDPSLFTWSLSHQLMETTQLQGVGFSLVLYAWKNE